MKACLAVCLLCMLFCEVICNIVTVGITPNVARDLVVPVTTNSVNLQKPYCYFNVAPSACDVQTDCEVWLVSSLTSAKTEYDNYTLTGYKAKYKGAYSSTGTNFSTIFIDTLDKIPCSAAQPYNVLVGNKDDPCIDDYCNGLLPEGQDMSFKYILVKKSTNKVVAVTNWTNNITLRSVKQPETLGSSYAGRSAAMVVITTILAVAMALLLLLLLIALILVCCSRQKTTHSYDMRHKPSLIGSLRIPSYDVHNLNKPSPYDNPAYEQNLKKRYTTTSTLPQTTVITHVQSNSPENVIMQKM